LLGAQRVAASFPVRLRAPLGCDVPLREERAPDAGDAAERRRIRTPYGGNVSHPSD